MFRIKDWFIGKMTKEYHLGGQREEPGEFGRWSRTYYSTPAVQTFTAEQIVRESEKAYQVSMPYVSCTTGKAKGPFKEWIPKSAVEPLAQWEATEGAKEKRIEEIGIVAYREERMQQGMARHEMLVQWAKDNGVKGVRVKMKRVTLIEKIQQAGLTVPTFEVSA
jgi:hypothetical protein